jgi:hypothetical protein
MEKQYGGFLKKPENRSSLQPSNTTPRDIPKEM